jgi:hypothetical protein
MKAYKLIFAHRAMACFACMVLFFSALRAQDYPSAMRYIQASNCDCSLGTLTNSSSIEWFGPCSNGYCNGYGTVNYYDPNGYYSGRYVGNVSQGLLNGFSTKYNADGTIAYQGRFKNNIFMDLAPFLLLNDAIKDFVVDSLLSGGIHRHCEILTGLFSQNDDLREVRYHVSCDGQLDETNHYTCTLVFSNRSPYIDIVDANDNAKFFITLNFIRYSRMLYNWFQRQSQNNQQ